MLIGHETSFPLWWKYENWTIWIGKPFSIDLNGQNQVPYGQNDGLYKKAEHKQCFGTKHHFHWDKHMKIWSVKSEFNFLLNGMVKTRSHMVQMMVYIGKTDLKHCLVTKHHFRWDKFTKIGPVKSENHFLSI